MPTVENRASFSLEILPSLLQQGATNGPITEANAAALALQLQSHEESFSSDEAIVRTFTKALEMRDLETKGHTERVTQIALDMAAEAGINQAGLENIRRGALIHDIGKLGVKDEILLKPGLLDERERAEMEKHVEMGVELVSFIPYFRSALQILQFHHEKWDGTGYPYRLKGEEIPLPARIFSIVDVWDAVTHKRVYKDAWPREQALDHLTSQSGRHFDPQVVDLFVYLEKQKGWYRI